MSEDTTQRRVVVTGLGMMTALGVGREATWDALLAGENGIGAVTLCDTSDLESRIAGEVTDFDPRDFIERKEARRMDRFVQLSIAATQDAMDQSALDVSSAADEIGVMIGSGMGGLAWLEDQFQVLFEKGPGRISPFLVPAFISDMAAGQVSIPLRRAWPELQHRLRLRLRRRCHRHRAGDDPPRRRARDDHRRQRRLRHAHGPRRLPRLARTLHQAQ